MDKFTVQDQTCGFLNRDRETKTKPHEAIRIVSLVCRSTKRNIRETQVPTFYRSHLTKQNIRQYIDLFAQLC